MQGPRNKAEPTPASAGMETQEISRGSQPPPAHLAKAQQRPHTKKNQKSQTHKHYHTTPPPKGIQTNPGAKGVHNIHPPREQTINPKDTPLQTVPTSGISSASSTWAVQLPAWNEGLLLKTTAVPGPEESKHLSSAQPHQRNRPPPATTNSCQSPSGSTSHLSLREFNSSRS